MNIHFQATMAFNDDDDEYVSDDEPIIPFKKPTGMFTLLMYTITRMINLS